MQKFLHLRCFQLRPRRCGHDDCSCSGMKLRNCKLEVWAPDPTFLDRSCPNDRNCVFVRIYYNFPFGPSPFPRSLSATAAHYGHHSGTTRRICTVKWTTTIDILLTRRQMYERLRHGLPLDAIGTSGPELFVS